VFVFSAEPAGCRASSRSATSLVRTCSPVRTSSAVRTCSPVRTSSPACTSSRCTLLGGRSGDCTAGDCTALGSAALTGDLGDGADVCGGSTGAGAACAPDIGDAVGGCSEELDADGCSADVVVTGASCAEGGGVMVAEVSAGDVSADGCGESSVGTGGVCAVAAAAAAAAAGAEPRMRVERGRR
jgi:hypothetical protein